MSDYRILEKDEVVQEGDEKDACNNPWHDDPVWVLAGKSVGQKAPDPSYPAHQLFRRRVGGAE